MISEWSIWCHTKTEYKARKIFDRVASHLRRPALITGVEYDADIPGYSVRFQIELTSTGWNDAAVELISLGQRVADEWRIYSASSGDPQIHQYACICANQTRLSGLALIEGSIDKRACI